jgi:K+-sensing histidine kinase KdpD
MAQLFRQDGYVPEEVVATGAAHGIIRPAGESHLPPMRGLPSARRWAGIGLVVVGLPSLTGILVQWRGTLSLGTILLLYLLAVVVVAAVGGVLPAVAAAVASFLLANWYLTPPYHTLRVEQRDSIIELVVFVVTALIVSVTVEAAAQRRVAAARSRWSCCPASPPSRSPRRRCRRRWNASVPSSA